MWRGSGLRGFRVVSLGTQDDALRFCLPTLSQTARQDGAPIFVPLFQS